MIRVGQYRRIATAAYIFCGLFLFASGAFAPVVSAAPDYDPYADAVNTQQGTQLGQPANSVGAPDGSATSIAGINTSITLDMGEGEEGTNSLRVHLGPLNVISQLRVAFLDTDKNILKEETRTLFLELTASTQTFNFNWQDYGKAYRYVQLGSVVNAGFAIDAIEALGYIGSTPTHDTDGDGIPDRTDGDPLDKANPGGGGGGNGGGGSGGQNSGGTHTTTTTTHTIRTNTQTSGSTDQVNQPAASADDADGDQMPDEWEKASSLNPNDPSDAPKDQDGDRLSNLTEYRIGTDPNKIDTDDDGMGDKWEYDNGLNARVNDAAQDPDGDFLTNAGEAAYDTNPYGADNIQRLGSTVERMDQWSWMIVILLLLGAVLGLMVSGVTTAVLSPRNKKSLAYRISSRVFHLMHPKK